MCIHADDVRRPDHAAAIAHVKVTSAPGAGFSVIDTALTWAERETDDVSSIHDPA
jgi:hypothetical protein